MLNTKDLPEARREFATESLQPGDGSQNGSGTAGASVAPATAAQNHDARGRFTNGNRAAQRARVAPERFAAMRVQLATRYAGSPLPAPIREPLLSELAHIAAASETLLDSMARFGLVSERGRRRPAYAAYRELMERAEKILTLLEPAKRGGKRRDPQQAIAELHALAAAQKG